MEQLLLDAQGLLFWGPGSFGAYIPPQVRHSASTRCCLPLESCLPLVAPLSCRLCNPCPSSRTHTACAHHLPPSSHKQVLSSCDLRKCALALLLDQATCSAAAARQLRTHASQPPAQLRLQRPAETALLMLARGVRCVAANALPTTSWANSQLLAALLQALGQQGASVATAAAAARAGALAGYELACVREAGLVVYGLPGTAASGKAGTGAGGKQAGAVKASR